MNPRHTTRLGRVKMSKIARQTLAFRPAGQFEVTLGSASEAFRLRCQAQNLSLGTVGWYKQLLKMFASFLEEQGVTAVRAFRRSWVTRPWR